MSKDENEAVHSTDTTHIELPPANNENEQPPLQTKRKRSTTQTVLTQLTIKTPPWTYIHLTLLPATTSPTIDALTVQLHLHSALSQFLGLHGAAIPWDILKLSGSDVWLRVPSADASAVIAATGGWIGRRGEGWAVRDWNCWGPDVGGADAGLDLFG